MIERFRDERRLRDAILQQRLVTGDPVLANAFASASTLKSYRPGTPLAAQGAIDDHLCLILAGSVEIVVNGQPIAHRQAGEHVGEMALLHPDGRRTATILAREEVVVACISEDDLSRIALVTH